MSDVVLRLGDCRDVMATLAAGSVDAIVTDPPYGTEVARDGYGRRQNYGGVGRAIAGDDGLSALEGMLAQAGRVLKADSWLAVFCSPKRHAEVAAVCERFGFPEGGEVVWDKASPGLGGGIRYQHETVLLRKHGEPTGKASMFSILRSHLSREGKANRHPHEKPVDVSRALVRYVSRPGDLILDPFAGTGAVLIACVKSGRCGVGVEIDPAWVPIAERRLAEARTPLFDAMEATG